MSEPQRTQWLMPMPACSEVNNAMQEFTGQTFESSDQHKELNQSRCARDNEDKMKFYNFLATRNPFSEESSLRNIETGVVADPNVNVDTADEIGLSIVKDMENQLVSNFSFKKSRKAITLGVKNSVKIGGDDIQVDPQLLFQRLLTVSDNSFDNPVDIFKYELCSYPASLFDRSGLPREAQKSGLAKCIWDIGCCGVDVLPPDSLTYVLDGGSLIHKLPWTNGSSFGEICQKYCNYVSTSFGTPHVVFDGYSNSPTTKDVTHERRTKGIHGRQTLFDVNTPFKSKNDVFLSNSSNKQNFINLLSAHLETIGCTVSNADIDSDLLIVDTAINAAADSPVAVIGEDTDILVLLCYYYRDNMHSVYFTSDNNSSTKPRKIWSISSTMSVLGEEICELLPVTHAFSGCDTTSHIYGIGKSLLFKKLMNDTSLRSYAQVFLKTSSQDVIQLAGEEIMVALYNGVTYQGLDILRYCKFLQKVQTKHTALQVQSLPPTSDAAKFHSLRVYLQIQSWLHNDLDPLDWGWTDSSGKLVPTKSTLPAAPERLLKCIRCACKQNYDSRRCTCRKHGLPCTLACGECRGTSCSNSEVESLDDDIEQ